jgi:hypothetical protein
MPGAYGTHTEIRRDTGGEPFVFRPHRTPESPAIASSPASHSKAANERPYVAGRRRFGALAALSLVLVGASAAGVTLFRVLRPAASGVAASKLLEPEFHHTVSPALLMKPPGVVEQPSTPAPVAQAAALVAPPPPAPKRKIERPTIARIVVDREDQDVEVTVDGVSVGLAPVRYPVESGPHDVRLVRRAGWEKKEEWKSIDAVPGRIYRINRPLPPQK